MKSVRKQLVLASLLAAIAGGAMAQPAPGNPPEHAPHGMRQHDPAKMQARMEQRQAELKAKLQITAAQEAAWSAFTTAMKPPADLPARPDHAEFARLTTPERIDRMQAMKARRDAEMAKRADATKTFYAALSPEQQKVFDSESLHMGGRMHRQQGSGHGGHGGPRG